MGLPKARGPKKASAPFLVEEKLLLSAKLQNATISLSAMPINRRCGFLFRKVSPPFSTIIHWLSAKTREWKTRDVAKCVL